MKMMAAATMRSDDERRLETGETAIGGDDVGRRRW